MNELRQRKIVNIDIASEDYLAKSVSLFYVCLMLLKEKSTSLS